jgi:hypothetical protein
MIYSLSLLLLCAGSDPGASALVEQQVAQVQDLGKSWPTHSAEQVSAGEPIVAHYALSAIQPGALPVWNESPHSAMPVQSSKIKAINAAYETEQLIRFWVNFMGTLLCAGLFLLVFRTIVDRQKI